MSTPDTGSSFLPYHEPVILTILVQSSFLILLNAINELLDDYIYCGLLGQMFIGLIWGTPLGKWLSRDAEHTITELGYLGLLLIVYEGGLNTNIRSLKANLLLSTVVALTGIAFPIALSFALISLLGASPLQAFAAGAALCSTSLGTTFTILRTSGLAETRLGVVLSSAAMMDDVVGLIMVQVISNLGTAFKPTLVLRPLLVSVGFAAMTVLGCRFCVKPVTAWLRALEGLAQYPRVREVASANGVICMTHILILLAFVAGGSFAGTSSLFTAYLAGAAISWWDSDVSKNERAGGASSSSEVKGKGIVLQQSITALNEHSHTNQGNEVSSTPEVPVDPRPGYGPQSDPLEDPEAATKNRTGLVNHGHYFAYAVQYVLRPFFFASIGFAIPITKMFDGQIIWRGLVFTMLMLLAKLVTGLWLIRFNIEMPKIKIPKANLFLKGASCVGVKRTSKPALTPASNPKSLPKPKEEITEESSAVEAGRSSQTKTQTRDTSMNQEVGLASHQKTKNPLSLYPAAILGNAMTARGEIGFLIASLAETAGIFAQGNKSSESSSDSSEIYLVIIWAVVLCTMIGPIATGTIVKRVKKLESQRDEDPRQMSPLGIWGVT